MKHRFLFSAALTAILLTPALLGAEEPTILSIRVSGLNRTSERTVLELLDRFVGKPASEAAPETVAAVLVGTGIFENVRSAAVSDGSGTGARLEVQVDEKWARIVVPVFYIDDGGASGGAALIDSNAFGRADALVAVGLILADGWLASTAYVDNRVGKRLKKNSVAAFVSEKEREDQNQYGEALRRYRALSAGVNLSSVFSILPFADAEAGLSFREIGVDSAADAAIAPGGSSRTVSARVGFSASFSSWNGTFLSERSARAGAAYAFAFVGPPYYELDFKTAWEVPLAEPVRLRFRSAAVYAPDAPAATDRSSSIAGISLLPSDFAAQSLVGASFGLEAKLARFFFGTLSATAAYEAAAADGELIGRVIAHGPTGGFRLYVAKVAVPAMDLTVAHNLETGISEARFGIGMRY